MYCPWQKFENFLRAHDSFAGLDVKACIFAKHLRKMTCGFCCLILCLGLCFVLSVLELDEVSCKRVSEYWTANENREWMYSKGLSCSWCVVCLFNFNFIFPVPVVISWRRRRGAVCVLVGFYFFAVKMISLRVCCIVGCIFLSVLQGKLEFCCR